jgi:hypothetical protein
VQGNNHNNSPAAIHVDHELEQLRDHRCFACLIGKSASKRACALAMLAEGGLASGPIDFLSLSLKSEHLL